jgi:hypothetical protein
MERLVASHAAPQPEAALMCAIFKMRWSTFRNQFVSTATRRARRLDEEAEQGCLARTPSPARSNTRLGLKSLYEHGHRTMPNTTV